MRWWLLFALAVPTWASASRGGIASNSCSSCHGNRAANTTTLTFSPSTFSPGETITLTVVISGDRSVGGLFLFANSNAFTLIDGQGTRLLSGGVTHTEPKPVVKGTVTFQVKWTAPTTPDAYDFQVYTLMGNNDGTNSGDAPGQAEVSGVFGCGAGTTYFRDFDHDGIGSSASGTELACSVPPGFSTVDGDCNDNDATVVPNGPELCNRRDDNCNGQVDEGLEATLTWPDQDHDGYGAANGASMMGCVDSTRVSNNTDCNDLDPAVHPGATEVCNNRDDNCDGQFDEGVEVVCGVGLCRRRGATCDIAQCVPGEPTFEKCNLLDDDCDGLTDEGDLCPAGQGCQNGRCVEGAPSTPDPTATPDAGSPSAPQPDPTCASVPGATWFTFAALILLQRALRRSLR